MRVEILADAIADAINKKCFLPALALALTIPDICAQYEYPDIYNKKEEYNGRKGQGAAYAKWYDEYIGKYEIPNHTKNEKKRYKEFYELDINTKISGFHLWKLRCELLHNGIIDLDKTMSDKEKNIYFTLTYSEYSNFKYMLGGGSSACKNGDNYYIELDVAQLCGKILAILRHTYLENEDFVQKTDEKRMKLEKREYNFTIFDDGLNMEK